MKLEEIISQSELVNFCKGHDIAYLAVFGSMASDQAKTDSDVDLLVRFRNPVSLIDHVKIKQELESLLNRNVDLITIEGLNPRLKDRILNSQKVIYDEAV